MFLRRLRQFFKGPMVKDQIDFSKLPLAAKWDIQKYLKTGKIFRSYSCLIQPDGSKINLDMYPNKIVYNGKTVVNIPNFS